MHWFRCRIGRIGRIIFPFAIIYVRAYVCAHCCIAEPGNNPLIPLISQWSRPCARLSHTRTYTWPHHLTTIPLIPQRCCCEISGISDFFFRYTTIYARDLSTASFPNLTSWLQTKNRRARALRFSYSTFTFFTFSYLISSFAFLQMYKASRAATASTARENIVNTIIFSFL